ncbi:MAG: DUF3786 domain-containing protein, partial [Desulfobacteraceae bacterium]
MEISPIFEKTYQDYLTQIGGLDLNALQDKLGIQVSQGKAIIPFFGKPYTVSRDGIDGPDGKKPHLSLSVILCKYLLMCPEYEPGEDDWVSFKDFKDAAPLTHAFATTVTNPICRMFSGRPSTLEKASKKIGGYTPVEAFSYDVSIKFDVLPKVSLMLLFNDKDEEFPAQCSVLFERRTENYLDMECVAMVGMLLY